MAVQAGETQPGRGEHPADRVGGGARSQREAELLVRYARGDCGVRAGLHAGGDSDQNGLAGRGKDIKGLSSTAIYVIAIPLSFVNPWIAFSAYVLVALIWFIPDRRIEKVLAD